MATFNHSGTTAGGGAGDETWDLVNDQHNVTGDFTVADGDTITVDISAALKQSDIKPINVTGNFSVNWDGKPVINGSNFLRIIWQSTDVFPEVQSWIGHVINAVDSGSSITFNTIRHASIAFHITGSYSVDNLALDKNRTEYCWNTIDFRAGVSSTFGDFEIFETSTTNGINNYGSFFFAGGASNINLGRLHFKNVMQPGLIAMQNQATYTIDTLICENSNAQAASFGLVYRRSGTGTVAIGEAYVWGDTSHNTAIFANNFEQGVMTLGGGIIRNASQIFLLVNTSGCIVENTDLYGVGATKVDSVGGANLDNCFVAGFSDDAARRSDISNITTLASGVRDGTLSVTSGIYAGLDSVLNPRSVPNFPLTITGVSAASETDGGATFTFTQNCPGESYIVFSQEPITVNSEEDLDDYKGRSKTEYFEWVDNSQNDELQEEIGTRTIIVDTLIEPGATIFFRIVGKTIWKELFWSDEDSFDATGGSVTVTTLIRRRGRLGR